MLGQGAANQLEPKALELCPRGVQQWGLSHMEPEPEVVNKSARFITFTGNLI